MNSNPLSDFAVGELAIAGPVALCLSCVLALVVSDYRDWRWGRYLFKPLAALAFLCLAINLGATDSQYGKFLLAGLLLCFAGDVLLMFEAERAFLTGLGAFLAGHLLYAMAFNQLPTNLNGLALAFIPALILTVATLRWLQPHLQGPMRAAVYAYMIVIAAMLVFAGGVAGQSGALWVICGAWGFALSDIAVARRQFVDPAKINGLWGTPLYFGSQMLLATSAAFF